MRDDVFSWVLQEFIGLGVNPYEILQIKQNYTFEELRKAYKKKALQHHPDRGGDTKFFDLVTKSYLYLVEEYRKQYQVQSFSSLKEGSKEAATQSSFSISCLSQLS